MDRRPLLQGVLEDVGYTVDAVMQESARQANEYVCERWTCRRGVGDQTVIIDLHDDPANLADVPTVWAITVNAENATPENIPVRTHWSRAADRLRTFLKDCGVASSACPACGSSVLQSTDPDNLAGSVCYCGHPRYHDDRLR